MIEISIPRIKRYALVLGVTGTVVALLTRGVKDASGFVVSAALAFVTIESWSRSRGSTQRKFKKRAISFHAWRSWSFVWFTRTRASV